LPILVFLTVENASFVMCNVLLDIIHERKREKKKLDLDLNINSHIIFSVDVKNNLQALSLISRSSTYAAL